MTRYMITFRSIGSQLKTKKVPQQAGEYIVKNFSENQNITINGDWYSIADVSSVQKITKENGFTKDFVEQQKRAELNNPDEKAYLESINQLPQLNNGSI